MTEVEVTVVVPPDVPVVNRCRCQRAQHFLSMTDLPLESVCWLAGFRNPKHMRVTFQQITGVTPSMYRERYQRRG